MIKFTLHRQLPSFIYGPGRGLKSTKDIEWQNKSEEADEWSTDDEEAEKEDEDIEEIEEDEDTLEIFIQENSSAKAKNKYVCLYCEKNNPDQTFTKKQIKDHFIDTHKDQFIEYFGNDGDFFIILILFINIF